MKRGGPGGASGRGRAAAAAAVSAAAAAAGAAAVAAAAAAVEAAAAEAAEAEAAAAEAATERAGAASGELPALRHLTHRIGRHPTLHGGGPTAIRRGQSGVAFAVSAQARGCVL